MLSSLLVAGAALTAVEVPSQKNLLQVSVAGPGSQVRACCNDLPGCCSAALMEKQAGSCGGTAPHLPD